MAKELYTLTAEDEAIFDLSRTLEVSPSGEILKCASFFTSYYIRTPDQERGWEFDNNVNPPWQIEGHHAPQSDLCIIGGYGSGKTVWAAMSYLTYATTLFDYKFLNVAPTGWQSKQMYDTLLTELEGTLYAEKFLFKAVEKPFPKITIKFKTRDRKIDGKRIPGRVVTSTMEFMSMSDDARRILTWEGDAINIDQGEQHESLSEAIVALGSRLRGVVKGRSRQARLSIIANSEDNPELWYIFDLSEEYPETNWSKQIHTKSNGNLTKQQIDGFVRRIKDPTKIDQYLGGARPTGGGIEFSSAMVESATDDDLDTLMTAGVKSENPEFEYREEREAGCVLWALPPDKTRQYAVFGDPGQGRPPYRNAPVVFVMDMTEYPKKASLAGFWWGDGGGKAQPFIDQFLYWRKHYDATMAAYDATAGQKVYSEWPFEHYDNILPIDLSGSGVKKKTNIMILKLAMLNGRLKWPRGIKGLRWQFLKYKLPDEKINQDIVAAFIVYAGYLHYLGLGDPLALEPKDESDFPNYYNRNVRPTINRHGGHGRYRR